MAKHIPGEGAGKGDVPRKPNPEYCDPKVLKTYDMGSIGCKNGFHTFYTEVCKYCCKTAEELKSSNCDRTKEQLNDSPSMDKTE